MFGRQIWLLAVNCEILGEAALRGPAPHVSLDRDGSGWLVYVDGHRGSEVCLHLQQGTCSYLGLLLVNFIRVIFVQLRDATALVLRVQSTRQLLLQGVRLVVHKVDVLQLLDATAPCRVQLLLRSVDFDEATTRLLVSDAGQFFK